MPTNAKATQRHPQNPPLSSKDAPQRRSTRLSKLSRRPARGSESSDADSAASTSSNSGSSTYDTPPPTRHPTRIYAISVPRNADHGAAFDLEKSALYGVSGIHAELTPSCLFPDAPMSVFRELPQTIYNRKTWRWTQFPDLCQPYPDGERERLVAAFLNVLYDHSRQWLTAQPQPSPAEDRRWLPGLTTRLQSDGTQKGMFGIVLVPSGAAVEWSTTLCDVQVVSSTDLIPEAVRNLSTSASYVFASQDNCLYHIGLVFAGAEFTIVIHDRAGRAQYTRRQVHKHGPLLAMLMAVLALADTTPLGRDPTIKTRADGTRLLTVNGVEYEIVERLFGSPHVRGRGTVCWRCRRPRSRDDYVIKSAWIDSRRTDTEASFLKEAAGVFGVPQLLDHEIVVGADGSRISTHRFRDCLHIMGRSRELQNVETLELHRLVMRPYALPLKEFRSKEELLSGVRDGVAAHWGLWDDRGILHCDISENNIMLRLDEPEEPLRGGILIDLDCATHVYGRTRVGPPGHRAGTLPFISCTRLLRPGVPHYAVHDLESFLYVLMWVCTSYSGPLRARAEPFDPYHTPLGKWQTSRDEKEVGQQKWDIMYVKTDSEFRAFLDETFDPFFDDLKDCVCELRRAILFSHGRVTHEDILDILEVHICAQ
ncbi:hypothetical protein HDZ31DRAFT_50039, partial [Schizophyllum fasciatum]